MLTIMPWTKERNNGVVPQARPIELFRRFDDVFDRLFDGYVSNYSNQAGNAWGIDLREDEKEIVVSLDAPGFEANEFDIQASDDGVTVSAEHVVTVGEESRTQRSFKRQVPLPSLVDPNKVEAKYRNGVLELRFPKAEPARWKKIEVKGE